MKLVAIQGNGVGERCRLLLHVSGNIPDLNAPFIEAHWYEADADISTDPYGEIEVDYEAPSHRWQGWVTFD
jgi:hypothetical protein